VTAELLIDNLAPFSRQFSEAQNRPLNHHVWKRDENRGDWIDSRHISNQNERFVIFKRGWYKRRCLYRPLMSDMYTDCSFVRQNNLHNHPLRRRRNLLVCSCHHYTGTDLVGTCATPLHTNIRQTRTCTWRNIVTVIIRIAEIWQLKHAGLENDGRNRRNGHCKTGKWRIGKWLT